MTLETIGTNRRALMRELERIATKKGGLTPELVVRDASRPTSPMHGLFEWDDSIAASKYRMVQAAFLIRSVKVTVVTSDSRKLCVRAFVSVNGRSEVNETGRYISLSDAMQDDQAKARMLRTALAELGSFRSKYSALKQLESLIETIDSVLLEGGIEA